MESFIIYGSAKIGLLNANQASLEIASQLLIISTFHGQFIFNPQEIKSIIQRKFLFGLFKSVKINHYKKEYKSAIFFHIPPFSGMNFNILKNQLHLAGF